jgi:hypothetical protein
LLENVLSVFLYKSYTRFKTLPLDKHLTFGWSSSYFDAV